MNKLLVLFTLFTASLFASQAQLIDGAGAAEVPAVTVSLVTTPVNIQSSSTHIYGWSLYNPNDGACYVEVFNSVASSVVLGTTTPVLIIPLGAMKSNELSFALPIKRFANSSVAAVTTPNGTVPCTVGVSGSFILANY